MNEEGQRTAEDVTTAELRQELKRAHKNKSSTTVEIEELLPCFDTDAGDDSDGEADNRIQSVVNARNPDSKPCPLGCGWKGLRVADHIRDDH